MILRKGKNTINMAKTGNMQKNSGMPDSTMEESTTIKPIRENHDILTYRMKASLLIFESLFGGFGSSGKRRQVKFRGGNYNAELHLDLADVYETHKQTLTVNGEKIRITIPAGIENGQTIKIPGHGAPGVNDGPNGDLYLKFSIADHPRFKRSGNDLFTQFDLDLYTAILGGEIIIETLDGRVKLKIKPGTQNGTKVKLKNKGFPVYKNKSQFGDLYITFSIKIPTGLTKKQLELFAELAGQSNKGDGIK